MLFWSVITAAAALVALVLALSFRRGRPEATGEADVALYRDQLAEVDRDALRGVLSAAEAEAVRTEVARRLLAADRATRQSAGTRTGPLAPGPLIGVLAAGLAILLYQWLGTPGMPDQSRAGRLAAADAQKAARPGQAEAETLYGQPFAPAEGTDPAWLALVERLRTAVAGRPDDLEGWRLLAQNEARLGNFAGAAAAQQRVVTLLGAEAPAAEHTALAALLIRAAGGFVSPEAEAALLAALAIEPGNGMALYYAGVLYAQNGRFDRTMQLWSPLLARSAPDDPWTGAIRAQIEAVAAAAGMPYRLPPAGPMAGPDADALAAAGEMDDAERQEMIRGMVEGLAGRLAGEGGPVADWARLVTSLAVLGEEARARAILDEARAVFAADPAALETLAEAARQSGIGQ